MTKLKAALLALALIVIGAAGGAAFLHIRALEAQRDAADQRASRAALAQGRLETANATLRAHLAASSASVLALKAESDRLEALVRAGAAQADVTAGRVIALSRDIRFSSGEGIACEARLRSISATTDAFMTRLMSTTNGR